MKLFVGTIFSLLSVVTYAQDSTKFAITTGAGIIAATGKLTEVLKPSVTFSSGVIYQFQKNWFLQGELSLNSIGYNQLNRDNEHDFLFKDAGSSLFQAGLTAGFNFIFGKTDLSMSFYGGPGYQRFGEPRIMVAPPELYAKQQILTKSSLFVKAGSRIAYQTHSAFLQTIYLEFAHFNSPVHVQQYRLQGITCSLGTKFSLM